MMMDTVFDKLLSHEVTVLRPVGGITGDLNVTSVSYEDVYGVAKRARLMPVRESVDQGILGLFPEATHLLYCGRLDLRAGYRVERELAEGSLAQAAQAGDEVVQVQAGGGFEQGQIVELSEGGTVEACHVTSVEGDLLSLASPLANAFGVGASVRAVERYRVLGVEDEGGAAHHLRAVLAEVAL
ncbi:MAG: hypothetical protein ACE5R4_15915 [Armatimonadota bacterium]